MPALLPERPESIIDTKMLHTHSRLRIECMSFLLFADGWPLNLTVAKN